MRRAADVNGDDLSPHGARPVALRLFAVVAVAALMALAPAPAARATHTANVFSGKWSTSSNGSAGGVSFSVIDNAQGAQALADKGGTPCFAPTTYYAGDYFDGQNNVGTMTACTIGGTRLVGRYRAPSGAGGLDVTYSSNSFSGSYTADDLPGFVGTYTGTFVEHFPTDGCCPGSTPPPPPPPPSSPPPFSPVAPSGGGFSPGGGEVGACSSTVHGPVPIAHVACGPLLGPRAKRAVEFFRSTGAAAFTLALCGAAIGAPAVPGGAVLEPWLFSACWGGTLRLAAADALHDADPPDRNYAKVVLPRSPPLSGKPKAFCGHLRGGACKRMVKAARRYFASSGYVTSLVEALAITANRFGTARAAGDVERQRLQSGAAKAYFGALASAQAQEQARARTFADLLGSGGRNIRLSGKFLRARLRRVGRLEGIPRWIIVRLAAFGQDAGELRDQLRARIRATAGARLNLQRALRQSIDTSAAVDANRSMTVAEVRALVQAFAAQREIPTGSAEALNADLDALQNAGDDAGRRRAVSQLVDDAHNRTPGKAGALLYFAVAFAR